MLRCSRCSCFPLTRSVLTSMCCAAALKLEEVALSTALSIETPAHQTYVLMMSRYAHSGRATRLEAWEHRSTCRHSTVHERLLSICGAYLSKTGNLRVLKC